MKTDTLLVEVRTEELPPPLVRVLAKAFPNELLRRLREGGFAGDDAKLLSESLATPRRFAALMSGVQARAKDRTVTRRGPQVKDCFDNAGKPSPALQGFMRAVGITDAAELERENEKGREYVLWRGNKAGDALDDVLAQMTADSMRAIPDLPSMHWDANDYAFVRPVRGLVMMHGGDVIPGEVMGAKSGNETRAHPALSKKPVRFKRAADYADALREANVIVDCGERESKVAEVSSYAGRESDMAAFNFGGRPGAINEEYLALIGDVTAMCEQPTVYKGAIDEEFWRLPPPCVASCLIRHQKCFPFLAEENGALALSGFFFVADNESQNEKNIIPGVNAVVRARLHDLAFYLQKDKSLTEKEAAEKLGGIVYHRKLGSQSGRAKRVAAIADSVGKMMNLDGEKSAALKRAAAVCKLDLPTMMVAEYPELAGKMAAYYFCGDGSSENRMARAIAERHGDDDFEVYLLDGSELPAIALFLADKLEKIIGMFLAGEKPAGRKDPHGLRRAAGQIADVLALENMEEPGLGDMSDENAARVAKLSLNALIRAARDSFGGKFDAQKIDIDEVREFIAKRVSLPGINTEVVNAVDELRPDHIAEIPRRSEALQEFLRRDEAPVLVAANKRINNILRKSDAPENPPFAEELLQESAEKALHQCVVGLEKKSKQLMARGDYQSVLSMLAADAAEPVREFFDKVMVNAEDDKLRANRLALLIRLRAQLNSVADLARLSG